MSALETGCKAPDFTAETTQGTLSLSDLLASSKRGVVIYFYPKASTPGCTKEACDATPRQKDPTWPHNTKHATAAAYHTHLV